MDIGRAIKRIRLTNLLTQEELANRSELTKGYISQIERNLTSPSIATLGVILQSLGTDMCEFFSEDKYNKIVFTKEDMQEAHDEENAYYMKWLVPNAQKNDMEAVMVSIDINGQTKYEEPHVGEEFGFILEGNCEIYLGKKTYKVQKGQSFYYEAAQAHYIKNIGKSEVKLIWVCSPPFF